MSVPLHEILLKLCRREDLTRSESREAFMHIMSGLASDAQIGGLLVGLAASLIAAALGLALSGHATEMLAGEQAPTRQQARTPVAAA